MADAPPVGASARQIALLRRSIGLVIVGKDEAVRLAVVGLLSGGHVLIEDIPGVGKTTLARALARSLACSFRRIQFTPDLLPSDITGISVYDQEAKEFSFKRGPIFTNIIVADEINRTTPRTQSALLEAMNACTVTVDGSTHALPRPFMVLATQNPMEFTGTYPLPESQLDRFLLRIVMHYPSQEEEKQILTSRRLNDPLDSLRPVLTAEQTVHLIEAVKTVTVADTVLDYLTTIIEKTRNHRDLLVGASPRASLGLRRAAQALALVEGRDYVLPDDIKALAVPVLSHRLVERERSRSGAASEAGQACLREIVKTTPVPL